jgi:hypothetical protein
MKIYLLNPPFVENFVRCGRWQGAATQGGGLAEQTHGDYVAFTDADCIPQKGWFENQACKFGNGIMGVRGGTRSIGKEFLKEVLVLARDTLLRQLDVNEMFIENDIFIVKNYQVPDFSDEHKREKIDSPRSCDTRWNTLSFESVDAMEKDDCTDSSPQYLQTLGLVSPFYHKTLVRELEV